MDASRPLRGASPARGGSGTFSPAPRTPPRLAGLIRATGLADQVGLAGLSVVVFAAGILPLELQRRIVNDAFRGGNARAILELALAYAAVALIAGGLKLVLNIYRGSVGENAVRWLRTALLDDFRAVPHGDRATREGIEVSLVLDEAEPIGGFVGECVSEPVLQGGILLGVFAYMVHLNPWMALMAFAMFSPQIVFVPLMQKAINRRVAFRIGLLRQVSIGIVVEPVAGAEAEAPQRERIQRIFALDMGIVRLKFTMNFLMNLLYHLGVAATLALGGYFVVRGRTEVGTVVAFIAGLGQINDPWGDLVNWFRDLKVTRTKYGMIGRAVRDMRGERI